MKTSAGGVRQVPRPAGREPADVGGPDPSPPIARAPGTAWNLARTTLTVVFVTSGLVALLEVWQAHEGVAGTTVAAVLMVALLTIQLFHFSRPGSDLRSPRGYVLLGLLALLAYVPLPEYGFAWISLPPFLAGCVLLVLPPAAAWTCFAAIMGSVWWIRVSLVEAPVDIVYGVVDAVLFGLVVYLLTRLAGTVAQLHTARDEMAKLAVAGERLRFARDLHDLLGLSLSAITLKGELTHRLLASYPERAKQELAEILDIARRALADVRSAASGYRELSLDQEARSAESVLRASDVTVHIELDDTELPVAVRTMLGMVLREGVTNVLRHSKAEHCDITVRQSGGRARLEIVNDGVVAEPATRDPDSGNGIRNLSDRVAAQQGRITTSVRPDGRFALTAEVPLPVPRSARTTGPAISRWATTRPAGTTLPVNTRATVALVDVAFVGVVFGAAVHVLMLTDDAWTVLAGVGYMTALLVLQLAYFSRTTTQLRTRQGYALLFVQACLIYLPLLQLGDKWVSLPGWLAGNALLMLPLAAGWTVFAGAVGTTIVFYLVTDASPLHIIFYSASTVITGLIVFGLTSLTKLIAELDTTRKQLATMAVAEERLRFARDLHDLLGLSLSAITLKGELTSRLLDTCPAQAAAELSEILGLARQALSDVRSVASGYRDLPFDQESQSAESVLTAADVTVRMDLDYDDDLPVRVRTVLAVVLREGVTNVLRHSRATHCDIVLRQSIEQVSLSIVNNGVTGADAVPSGDGRVPNGHSGIRNLSERVAKLGGELRCGASPGGAYELRVKVPL